MRKQNGSEDGDQDVLTRLEGLTRGRHLTEGRRKHTGITRCLEELQSHLGQDKGSDQLSKFHSFI